MKLVRKIQKLYLIIDSIGQRIRKVMLRYQACISFKAESVYQIRCLENTQNNQIRGNFYILFIVSLFNNHLVILAMIKQFVSKKQNIRDKICAKLARIKQEQDRKSREDEYDSESCSDYYEQSQEDYFLDPLQEARQDFKNAAIKLARYLNQYQNEGDSQYTHKLLFDFFRTQSIFQNMHEDGDNMHIYQKYIEAEVKKQEIAGKQTKNDQTKQSNSDYLKEKQSQMKKMTMKDKLQSGKFCSFDNIPEYGQIQDYKSISSEDQILDQDCLEQLIHKMKKDKIEEKPKYERKKKEKSGKGRKNSRQAKQAAAEAEKLQKANLQNSEQSKSIYRVKSQKVSRKINFSNKRNTQKTLSDQQDSSNEANYDSQQSDSEGDVQSEEEYGSDDHYQHDELDYEGALQQFKHLDMYEQIQFPDEEIDYALNTAIHSGKQKKIHGIEQYHFMKKTEKQKYFKKMTKQYQSELKRAKQSRKQQKKEEKAKKSQGKVVSFSDSIFYKSFNSEGKPNDVKISDQKQEVLVKAIWEYEDQ